MKASLALAALVAVALSTPVAAADKPAAKPAAAKGVKCGDSYIAAGKTCTKSVKPMKVAEAAHTKPVPAAKGVKCGGSYIAAGKTCTKK